MKPSENDLVNEWNEEGSQTKWQTADSWQNVVPQSGDATIADPSQTGSEAEKISSLATSQP